MLPNDACLSAPVQQKRGKATFHRSGSQLFRITPTHLLLPAIARRRCYPGGRDSFSFPFLVCTTKAPRQKLADRLWIVGGPTHFAAGFGLGRQRRGASILAAAGAEHFCDQSIFCARSAFNSPVQSCSAGREFFRLRFLSWAALRCKASGLFAFPYSLLALSRRRASGSLDFLFADECGARRLTAGSKTCG